MPLCNRLVLYSSTNSATIRRASSTISGVFGRIAGDFHKHEMPPGYHLRGRSGKSQSGTRRRRVTKSLRENVVRTRLSAPSCAFLSASRRLWIKRFWIMKLTGLGTTRSTGRLIGTLVSGPIRTLHGASRSMSRYLNFCAVIPAFETVMSGFPSRLIPSPFFAVRNSA